MSVAPLSTRTYQPIPGNAALPRDPQPPISDFLLQRGPYSDRPEVWSLDFAHRHPFGAADSGRPSLFDEAILPIEGLADELAAELEFRSEHPQIVLIGPHPDPLLPLPDVQSEIARVVEVLASHGIVAWLSTRGRPLL